MAVFRLLIVLSLAAVVYPAHAGDRVPLPDIAQGKGEQCVEPTEDMRRNHMRYLTHQRDETVHRGIRTKQHSLSECIACHAGVDEKGRRLPVNAPGQFCASCHRFAAVRVDCFQCHATVPDTDAPDYANAAAAHVQDAVERSGLAAAGKGDGEEQP